jgi:hypothetical protein
MAGGRSGMREKELILLKMFAMTIFLIAHHSNFSFGQSMIDSSKVFYEADVNPEFPGGENELKCFFDKALDKDKLKLVSKKGISIAQFIINETGTVTEITIIKSLDTIADNELMRIIKLMPKWKPGEYHGKIISTVFSLPLRLPYENKCGSEK